MKKLIGFGTAFLVLAMSGAAMAQDHGEHERQDHGDHKRQGHGEHERRGHGEQAAGSPKTPVGTEVKDFALTDSTGKAFRLGTLRRTEKSKGTITVLTFWCTTCGSCRENEKDFDEKAKEYKEKGVQFLMVDSNFTDSAERVNRFLESNKLSFPVLMDSESEFARYLGATATTTTVVIDAEGRLRYYGGFGKAEDAVRNLLAGEDVAVPETRTMGCMIMLKPLSEKVEPK